MEKKYIIIISSISFIVGLLFFALYNERIVIRSSQTSLTPHYLANQKSAHKKTVSLMFWNSNKWKSETQEIIWGDNKQENLTHLVNSWLHLIAEENKVDKKITLQAALLAPGDYDAFISFDASPLPQNGPTIDKIRLLEGLLKTIRENNLQLQTIQFLVDHQPLKDTHLNFVSPWPISGFLES